MGGESGLAGNAVEVVGLAWIDNGSMLISCPRCDECRISKLLNDEFAVEHALRFEGFDDGDYIVGRDIELVEGFGEVL